MTRGFADGGERPVALTTLLASWRGGDEHAGRELMAASNAQLRRLAARYLRAERANHTLQATELVNELFLRLFPSEPVLWTDRVHFFAVAARQLRRILVDHARARGAQKRGGDVVRVTLTGAQSVARENHIDVLDVDNALTRLEAIDPRAAAGVELRFFAGLTESEIAAALNISLTTLHRDWTFSRAWLVSQLGPRKL